MPTKYTFATMFFVSLALHLIAAIIWFQTNLVAKGIVRKNNTIINVRLVQSSHETLMDDSAVDQGFLLPKHTLTSNKNKILTTGKTLMTTKPLSSIITHRVEATKIATINRYDYQELSHSINFTSARPKTEIRTSPAVIEQYSSHVKENYLSGLRKYIMQQKYYPLRARRMGKQGGVSMGFVIYRDGHIESINIQISSGETILDRAAYNSIEAMGTYLPFPDDISEGLLTVAVRMNYRLQ